MNVDLTAIAEVVVGAVRTLGPYVLAAALALLASQLLSTSGRARLTLAVRGLSGQRRPIPLRLVAGTLIPTLGVAALAVSLSLEKEVREGPNRMLAQLQGGVPDDELAWVLQRGTGHFMDDSRLPPAVTRAVTETLPERSALLYGQLAQIRASSQAQPDTALIVASPADAAVTLAPLVDPETAECQLREGRCLLQPGQIVTDADRYPIGGSIGVRGQQLTFVAHALKPYSLINRVVAFAHSTLFSGLAEGASPAYAALVVGPDAQQVAQDAVAASGAAGSVEVLTPAQLRAENARFWAGNGTPLLMLMILLSGSFCGVALYGARRAMQEREHVVIGTLRALGLRPGQTSTVDLLRTLIATTIAVIFAWPLAAALIWITGQGMIGFHAQMPALTVIASAGLIVLANALGTLVLWLRLRSQSVMTSIGAA